MNKQKNEARIVDEGVGWIEYTNNPAIQSGKNHPHRYLRINTFTIYTHPLDGEDIKHPDCLCVQSVNTQSNSVSHTHTRTHARARAHTHTSFTHILHIGAK